MEGWSDGGVEGWRGGGVEGWRGGGVERWRGGVVGLREFRPHSSPPTSNTPILQYSITPPPLPSPSPSLPRRNQYGQNRRVKFCDKIIGWEKLPDWRAAMRASGKRLVVTNGCFDLLHLGHVTYLETARQQGDALLIGVNSDAAVRQLKGPDRPVTPEHDRAAVLAALESVDGACIFAESTATRFLAAAQPDIYVKGGDYTLDTLNQEERRTVEQAGGRIVIIPFVPGKSTTALLKKIMRL